MNVLAKGNGTGKGYAMFIGRWQPWHAGHRWLIDQQLEKGKKVLLAIRDVEPDEKNPFTVEERMSMIIKEFGTEIYEDRVTVVVLPDIKEVCHGRKVGWGVREIRLDEKTEEISGTKTRKEMRKKGEL